MLTFFSALIFSFSMAAAASFPLICDLLETECFTTDTLLVLLTAEGAADLYDWLLSLFTGEVFLGEVPWICCQVSPSIMLLMTCI